MDLPNRLIRTPSKYEVLYFNCLYNTNTLLLFLKQVNDRNEKKKQMEVIETITETLHTYLVLAYNE